MKILRRIFKLFLFLLAIPIVYLAIALLLTYITTENRENCTRDKLIYLSTNGVHADVIIPVRDLSPELQADLFVSTQDQYLAFGWGDRDFYLNTPQWSDLTVKTAVNAAFLKSKTLMHLTNYSGIYKPWIPVSVCDAEQKEIMEYLTGSFTTKGSSKVLIPHSGYSSRDYFYEANGSYNCFFTCNTWLNKGLKKAGLKTPMWTPFDFGVLRNFEDKE